MCYLYLFLENAEVVILNYLADINIVYASDSIQSIS